LLCSDSIASYAAGCDDSAAVIRDGLSMTGAIRLFALLLALAMVASTLPGTASAQAVNWRQVLADITAPRGPGQMSRVDPETLEALEREALTAPMPDMPEQGAAAPRAASSAAASLEAYGRLAQAETPMRERPADLEAYGRLADEFGNRMVTRTTEGVNNFRTQIRQLRRRLPEVPGMFTGMLARASATGEASAFIKLGLFTLTIIVISRLLGGLIGPLIGLRIMRTMQRRFPPVGMAGKLPVLATRVLITIFVVLLATIPTALIGLSLADENRTPAVSATVIIAVGFWISYFVIDAMWRMVLSPYLAEYRLPKIDDAGARKLYLWLSASVFTGLLGESIILWMEELGGERALIVLSSILLRLVAVAVIIAMILINGPAIRSAILGGRRRAEASWWAALAATVVPPLVILYFIAAWLEGAVRLVLDLDQGLPLFIGPFVTLMTSLMVYAVATYAVEVYFRRARLKAALNAEAQRAEARQRAAELEARRAAGDTMPETAEVVRLRDDDSDGDDDEGGPGSMPELPESVRPHEDRPAPRPHGGMRTFEELGYRVASLLAASVALYMMVRIWAGPEVFQDGGAGDWVGNIIDKLFLGYIAFHGVRIWLDQKIEDEGGDAPVAEPGDEGGGASSASRLATLLPLLRAFVLIVIGTTVVLLVAMDFGVNVAPLFAGAGIVGLALGFGAQTLVRDILSGLFFLLDDAFRKGEYVDVGEVKGTVEKISLRSFQLRHHLGALNTIPFGEIKHLTNFSRDWVMMKLPLRLTYDTDVDKVRKLIKKLGEELLEHPTEGHKFVQPLKSQGVYMMEDSAMIFRVKFMTRPGDQWTTRKLVYQEIRNLFQREGIKFAHREVTVRVSDQPAHATPEQVQAAGAAARRAIEADEQPTPLAALSEGR
jgi:small-conductance mechanosensitive channel